MANVVDGDGDLPVRQFLKVLSILDCVPGHARSPVDGIQIAIVTAESGGEIEQPIMLKLPDVRKLAYSLVNVLAHFGDEQAKEIIQRYCSSPEGSNDA